MVNCHTMVSTKIILANSLSQHELHNMFLHFIQLSLCIACDAVVRKAAGIRTYHCAWMYSKYCTLKLNMQSSNVSVFDCGNIVLLLSRQKCCLQGLLKKLTLAVVGLNSTQQSEAALQRTTTTKCDHNKKALIIGRRKQKLRQHFRN